MGVFLKDDFGEAFIIEENFIGKDACILVLGENIFYGHRLKGIVKEVAKREKEAIIIWLLCK